MDEIHIDALKSNPLAELSFVKKSGKANMTTADVFQQIIEQFAHVPSLKDSGTLALNAHDEPEETAPKDRRLLLDAREKSLFQPKEIERSFLSRLQKRNVIESESSDEEIETQLTLDKTEFNLNDHMNSGRLMRLKLDMEKFEGSALTVEEFVMVTSQMLRGVVPSSEEELINNIVDSFYRIDKFNSGRINFEMVSSFLIEHDAATEAYKERVQLYHLCETVVDESRHDNYIDRLYYFSAIDKVVCSEQSMKNLKIYNAETLKYERQISCSKAGNVTVAEFISNYHTIVVASSDKTMNFYEPIDFTLVKTFVTPESQQTMLWSQKHKLLFTGGLERKIYGWKLDLILGPDHKGLLVSYSEVIAKGFPWRVEDSLMCMTELTTISQLATGSVDRKIRLWDIKEETLSLHGRGSSKQMKESARDEEQVVPRKVLVGHLKAVKDMAYSATHNLLVSCSFEFVVLVWNPYVSSPIAHLLGHEAPMVGIQCPPVNHTIITADSKGIVKVWDIRDFGLIQSFYVPNVVQIKAMKTLPKHRRIAVAARKIIFFEYERPFIPDLTDDYPINCACYSNQYHQLFIGGHDTLKVWNGQSGRPVSVIPGVVKTEITAMCIDESHRRVILGDHKGKITKTDSLSGALLKEFQRHTSEVSGLFYIPGDKLLISTSWDRSMYVHLDSDVVSRKDKSKGLLRSVKNAHSADITCVAYSETLDLIATGSRDNTVRLWEFETCKLEGVIKGHDNEILLVSFIEPFGLLFISDYGGSLSLWKFRRSAPRVECIVKWKNMHTLDKTASITAASYFVTGDLIHLVLGDEKGNIRVMEFGELQEQKQVKPMRSMRRKNRNPTRMISVDMNDITTLGLSVTKRRNSKESRESDEGATESSGVVYKCRDLKDDHMMRQVHQWTAHTDSVKFIAFISDLATPGLITTGLDQLAKLWTTAGEHLGTLQQTAKGPNTWNFGLHEQAVEKKRRNAHDMLDRVHRDIDSSILTRNVNFSLYETSGGDPDRELTAAEMLKNISELEDMMPRDPRLDEIRQSSALRSRRTHR